MNATCSPLRSGTPRQPETTKEHYLLLSCDTGPLGALKLRMKAAYSPPTRSGTPPRHPETTNDRCMLPSCALCFSFNTFLAAGQPHYCEFLNVALVSPRYKLGSGYFCRIRVLRKKL